jgi:alkylation response protein AidB-like acyl-CoA dehydrogenase
VDFELSPDQQDLRSAAAGLLDAMASRERVRAFVGPGTSETDGDEAGAPGFDPELWGAMTEQGWTAVEEPVEAGGLGLGMVEVAVLCEELGRRAAPVPYAETVLCLGALARAEEDEALSDSTRQVVGEWRARLSSGDGVGCVAWSSRPDSLVARAEGETWEITGRPEPTRYASVADVAVVATGDGLFAVPLGDGDRPSPEPAMDRTRPLSWLRLEGKPARRIGGVEAVRALVDRAATTSAADLLGASARVLEMSVEYAKVRKQFGHPIGSFQAIKHRLADALVDVEGMRSSTYYAAWCLASADPESSVAASMAKAWCSDASRRVTATGLQVHGGIGFTWEYELHLHLKRAQLDASTFGDAAWHRDRIAGQLAERMAAGQSPL